MQNAMLTSIVPVVPFTAVTRVVVVTPACELVKTVVVI